MSSIVIFGAGGRGGRRAVAEAVSRGHQVTAAVRDPGRHADLAGDNVTLIAADVTVADDVAKAAAGHDAAISSVYRADLPSREYYPAAAHALIDGLGRAGVARLVVVGIGTALEIEPGVALHDQPGVPPEHREFSLGHTAELEVFRTSGGELDWVIVAPPPVFLDEHAERTGVYRSGDHRVLPRAEDAKPFSYADLAVALVDEDERPAHSRAMVAVDY
ncbi:NmrA family transcriptional regulator [Amycolatopsis sp. MJM2582]|uniref:NAD(P)-dependent oxidoreductase n=1 Tax=Amycolatopsis sp. MJM2582 TaxID=1427749 RepID=UPI000501E346|nr:NAD(P)H-binding protein [Amycolatopsis sp. MJM2582]KFZ79942.1 NmrA family transcriptional regulator [Amycolatopsis sp. MJM2582]